MSRSYEYSYALERARRQAIYNERVSSTTERFYNRYMKQYEEMISRGYSAYIPSEMKRLQSDLSSIRNLLMSNPTEARDLSFEVGSYINDLYSMANIAVQQFDRAERIRRDQILEQEREKKIEGMNIYYELIREISNPIVINFAQEELEAVKKSIKEGTGITLDQLKSKVKSIIQSAESKAEGWKKETVKVQKKNNIISRLEETEKSILNEKIEDKKKTDEFIDRIQKLKESISSGNKSIQTIEKEISQIETVVDDTIITEEVRRETVKAIVKQLRSQEFVISRPQIVKNGDESYVKIVAQKPSGKKAVCKVDLHGKILYKFDNYEGLTCLKDIEKFNVDLEKIYSVKLSDERILWSNPDKLSKDAESVAKSKERYV